MTARVIVGPGSVQSEPQRDPEIKNSTQDIAKLAYSLWQQRGCRCPAGLKLLHRLDDLLVGVLRLLHSKAPFLRSFPNYGRRSFRGSGHRLPLEQIVVPMPPKLLRPWSQRSPLDIGRNTVLTYSIVHRHSLPEGTISRSYAILRHLHAADRDMRSSQSGAGGQVWIRELPGQVGRHM